MDAITAQVRDQYDKFPYPEYSWLAKLDPASCCHASFETGYALVHRKIQSHAGTKIALLGCGTFEPYAQGTLHPQAHIAGVDLSPSSLKKAQWRCRMRNVKNVTFHYKNLLDFCEKNKETYDFIHCFGVLHHLENPQKGFEAISQSLTDEGFARIMVYSASQRFRTHLIQKAARLLGLDSKTRGAVPKIKKLLGSLPISHPLRLSQILNSELETRSGVVDSLLHAWEKPFTLSELKKDLKTSHLYIHEWDFSENALKLLSYAPERDSGSSIEEKIQYLEAFDQWPTGFTVWVSKIKPHETPPLEYRTNPHLRGQIKRAMRSTVLRKTLKLSSYERDTLEEGLKKPIVISRSSHKESLENLISARFLLGIDLWT